MAQRGAAHKLSVKDRHAIVVCRIVMATGWTIEYVEGLSMGWIGNLLSYDTEMSGSV